MPVYFFTYHAYRSWMPDHKRGFVQKGKRYQPPNPSLANAYNNAASFPPFEFDHHIQRFIIEVVHDVCQRRAWRHHGSGTEPTHLHSLVSWRDATRWQDVCGKIRNIISLQLSKRFNHKGRRWLVEDSSRRRVKDQEHFDYLVEKYIPKHGGWRWIEERGWYSPGSATPASRRGLPGSE
ncbi:MAG: hypothetical protein ACREIT_08595 [Tepidisphaeraceae bacterium]